MQVRQWIHIVFLVLLVGLWTEPLMGQDRKLVSGRVTNKNTKKPFTNEAVFVYAFNTVAEAEDARKIIDSRNGYFESNTSEVADANGYYQILVPENGALIFKIGVTDCVLEKVNYRMEINVAIPADVILDEAKVVAIIQGIFPLDEDIEIEGNYLRGRNTIPIPSQFGKTNARLILQPYLLDGATDDTLTFLKPLVYDGEQYRLTQERRMDYRPENDPLAPYVVADPLTSDEMRIGWADTIYLEEPAKSYYVKGVVRLEDYNQVYHEKELLLASSRIRRPLKFLEYNVEQRMLDPNKYRERPRRERRNTAGNISLTFVVGKAQLDPKDPKNEEQMSKLKEDLLAIVQGEGSTLKEFHITGVASPDGGYQSNYDLARKRVQFAQAQVTSVLPKRVLARVYQNPKAQVAPWTDVVMLMEKDSLMKEAAEIKKIVEQYPKNRDIQSAKIARLPFYRPTIVDYLPKLRSVKYEYIHEIYRELTPQEIIARYKNDKDYRSGKKRFALYEYWHLFQMVKDTAELEALYKRAYEESKEENVKPWVLAANNLALAYLNRGVVDTTLLLPFIDTRFKGVNIPRKRVDGSEEILNPEAVVANQLCMYLKANNFRSASVMAQLLPDTEKNKMVKAFTMCLGGYYKGGRTPEERARAKEVFDRVKESTPLNKVVMYLALNSKGGDVLAEQAMAALPAEDALTYYLWAIINGRKGMMNEMEAEDWLVKCFKKDRKYIDMAASDGDIPESVFKSAKERLEFEVEMMQ